MKKISLLFLLFLCVTIGKTFAGSFTIMNLTPCTFEFYSGLGHIVDPVTGATYYFGFDPITANTGTNTYQNPTLLPGFNTNAPANLQASGCVEAIKVIGPAGTSIFLTGTAPFNSFISTNNPACNNGNNYAITWTTGGNGCDVAILIL